MLFFLSGMNRWCILPIALWLQPLSPALLLAQNLDDLPFTPQLATIVTVLQLAPLLQWLSYSLILDGHLSGLSLHIMSKDLLVSPPRRHCSITEVLPRGELPLPLPQFSPLLCPWGGISKPKAPTYSVFILICPNSHFKNPQQCTFCPRKPSGLLQPYQSCGLK